MTDAVLQRALNELWIFEEDNREPWRPGQRVQAYFGGNETGRYYGGKTLRRAGDSSWVVRFDDGDVHTVRPPSRDFVIKRYKNC